MQQNSEGSQAYPLTIMLSGRTLPGQLTKLLTADAHMYLGILAPNACDASLIWHHPDSLALEEMQILLQVHDKPPLTPGNNMGTLRYILTCTRASSPHVAMMLLCWGMLRTLLMPQGCEIWRRCMTGAPSVSSSLSSSLRSSSLSSFAACS